jgi:phytoene dehydrogenase-like protein
MPQEYDAIVIGGGHNGLVNAAYLAKAGKKTLVLERRHVLGGASVTEEVFPGFKFTVFSYVVSLFRPEIIRDLDLTRHGLTILPLESTLTPLPDGNCLYRDADHYRTMRAIARFSPRDADAYDDYSREMYFMAKAVRFQPFRPAGTGQHGTPFFGAGRRAVLHALPPDDHEFGGFSRTLV